MTVGTQPGATIPTIPTLPREGLLAPVPEEPYARQDQALLDYETTLEWLKAELAFARERKRNDAATLRGEDVRGITAREQALVQMIERIEKAKGHVRKEPLDLEAELGKYQEKILAEE